MENVYDVHLRNKYLHLSVELLHPLCLESGATGWCPFIQMYLQLAAGSITGFLSKENTTWRNDDLLINVWFSTISVCEFGLIVCWLCVARDTWPLYVLPSSYIPGIKNCKLHLWERKRTCTLVRIIMTYFCRYRVKYLFKLTVVQWIYWSAPAL